MNSPFESLESVQSMIAGTVSAFKDQPRKVRLAALKACQWRLVTTDGRAVQQCNGLSGSPAAVSPTAATFSASAPLTATVGLGLAKARRPSLSASVPSPNTKPRNA